MFVISSKHCLCLQLELRPTGTPVRLKNLDYLGLKPETLPDRSLKNARWDTGQAIPCVRVQECAEAMYIAF